MSKEVLIIGAGACGLLAAKLLVQKGFLVTIIEGRNRVGGRIFTETDVSGNVAELGAEFIHGDQPFTLALAKECGAEVSELSGKWYQVRNGKVEESELFDGQWEEMIKKMNDLTEDIDLASFLNTHYAGVEHAELRESVRGFVEGYDAAEMDKASVFALREEWAESDEAPQYRLAGGYGKLIDYLRKSITNLGGSILLSTEVVGIEWSKRRVSLETADGRIVKGERVVITIPIGVLQRDTLRFSPELPYRKDIFNKIGFGGVIKFVVHFSEKFWESVVRKRFGDLAFIVSDAEVPTWWIGHEGQPGLTGWWGGPSTIRQEDDEATLMNKAFQSLCYILDCSMDELQKSVLKSRSINWVQDSFSRGAYAYATVNSAQARKILSIPIEDTLYFAGEALYSGSAMGTVEAALVSGREVSNRISGLRGVD